MSQAEVVMRIRFKSDLALEQLKEIVETRAPEFEALSGLKQKYYLQDIATGEYAGLFIWRLYMTSRSIENPNLEQRLRKPTRHKGSPISRFTKS
jgi:hypothetical protein